MMHTLFLFTVGGALATVRESASCVPLEGVAVQGPILKSLAGVSNLDVCCDECSNVANCSAFTINGTLCELHQSTSVISSANVTSGIIKASPSPPGTLKWQFRTGNPVYSSDAVCRCCRYSLLRLG